MTRLVAAEIALALLGTIVFMVLYATRSPWQATAMGRHMMIFTLATVGELGSLLLLSLGWRVPLWVFAAGFAALDVVVFQRLWLLWRAQRMKE